MSLLTDNIAEAIKAVPYGKVTSYGEIARAAGNPRAVRQVVFVLHSKTAKENLPWHRIIRKEGEIAIKDPEGAFLQKKLMESEGVEVSSLGIVDMKKWGIEASVIVELMKKSGKTVDKDQAVW